MNAHLPPLNSEEAGRIRDVLASHSLTANVADAAVKYFTENGLRLEVIQRFTDDDWSCHFDDATTQSALRAVLGATPGLQIAFVLCPFILPHL